MAFGDDDLSILFGDFGVPISCGGVTVQGLVDAPDVQDGGATIGNARLRLRETVVTIPNGSLPAAKQDAKIVVDGIAMVVRAPLQSGDAALEMLYCVRDV